MAAEITPLQRLQQSTDRMDRWIAENKPSPSKSQKVFTEFMERYGPGITGSEHFIAKTTRIIQKTSCLATGVTIMERLLRTGHDMPIYEGKGNHFEPDTSSLCLNVSPPQPGYICLDSQGERRLTKAGSHAVTFIHEGLHAWHEFIDAPAHRVRIKELGSLPEMDTAEEELAITGYLHLEKAPDTDFCCENTALREFNCPPRINHRGLLTEVPDLHNLVEHRILPTIRELSQSGQIHNEKKDGATPLERALFLYLLESDPQVTQELMDIIRFLIQSGGQSECALKIAILQNSKELMALLLQAGVVPTDEVMGYATKGTFDRFDEIWKMLEQAKLVVTDKAIEDMSKMLYVPPPGADWDDFPIIKAIRQRDAQRAAVKAKFSDQGTLPVHALEKTQAARSQAEESIKIPCIAIKQPTTTFEFMPDGACVPLNNYHSYFPECHKSYKNFGGPRGSFFTQMEREIFIQTIDAHHINSLANTLSGSIMEQLQIGYTVERSETLPDTPDCPMPIVCHQVSRDHKLSQLLTDLVTTQIKMALSSQAALVKGGEDYYFPTYYFDIPIISEEQNGLLQQIKHEFDGKYLDSIELLKTEEGRPVSSVICRLILEEHPEETLCRLHFACEILVNNKKVKVFGF